MASLSALPPQQQSWSDLIERDDIVLDGGILHLVHDSVTPQEARIADLLLVADALYEAGVATLLIRHDRAIPALVADLADMDAVTGALAALGTREPAVRERTRPAAAAGRGGGRRRGSARRAAGVPAADRTGRDACGTAPRSPRDWSSGGSATTSSRRRTTTP